MPAGTGFGEMDALTDAVIGTVPAGADRAQVVVQLY